MTKALIMSLHDWWHEQTAPQPIQTVILQVGAFTCVEPALLTQSFAQQRQSVPFLQEAELVIRDVPFVAFCETCQHEYTPQLGLHYACPTCQAALHHIRSGRELKIERVMWKEIS